MSDIYFELEKALVVAGLPLSAMKRVKGCDIEVEGPIAAIVNLGIDASPYVEILLAYAPRLVVPAEIEMVARCMTQPAGFSDAAPWLLSLFERFPGNGLSEGNLWAIGNALYVIDAKSSYSSILSICQDKRFGTSRQMLMGTLARARTDEAFDALVECLAEPSVRGHAIEALGRFGRVAAIAVLEPLVVQKGLFEFRAKATAIRRVKRLQAAGSP